jgi:membrane associated rhomboid family serine protease
VIAALIALNAGLFLYQASLGIGALNSFVRQWGIVPDQLNVVTLATSMFLHGGWLHLIGNMWFLWVFGRNLEDSMGSGRFVVFYLACGLAAAVVHVILNPYSRVPTIGASGAIAGVMGGYLIRAPKSHIDTLVFLFVFVTRIAIPAPFFLIYWFVIQFFSGIGSLGEADYTGGTAWFAHIGGFLAGMLLVRRFKDRRPAWRPWYEED